MNTSRTYGARERVQGWVRELAVTELCGPSGFWAGCREAARTADGAFLDAMSAPSVARLLDDRLPAAGGAAPSARLAGLVGAARLAMLASNGGYCRADNAGEWLGLIGGVVNAFRSPAAAAWVAPAPAGLQLDDGSIDLDTLLDHVGELAPAPELALVRDLLDDVAARPFLGRSTGVRVLLGRAAGRGAAIFSVRDVPGPAGLLPDVTEAAFSRWDEQFQAALDRAWWAAGLPQRGLRWSLRWEATGQPVPLVEGPSIGLGAALAIAQASDLAAWGQHSGWALTGDIDEAGEVLSLLDGSGELNAAYRDKLSSVPAGATVILPEADRSAVTRYLHRSELAIEVEGISHLDALRTVDEASAVLAPAAAVCPYRGLGPFEADDAMWFHGREKVVAELARLLGAHRLVGVLGASGAGKSSTVRAGLLPLLGRGVVAGSERWPSVVCTPGADPWGNLLEALHGVGIVAAPDDPDGFVDTLAQRGADAPTLLIVVDQLEELFTMAGAERAGSFLAALAGAAQLIDNVRIVPIVRADFYGECSVEPHFARLLSGCHVLVGPMTAQELRRVVTAPAASAGLVLEAALVDTVLGDVTGQPNALPHLSTALRETWARRDGRTLTLAGYEQAGGVDNAIAQLADQLFVGADETEQARMRRLILRLVGLGEERNFRRRSSLGELAHDREDRAVLEKMTAARLVAVSDQGVELAHDAVISYWPRLGAWLDESREQLLAQRRLAQGALDLDADGRLPDGLLRGARLTALTEQLRAEDEPVLTELESEYLRASQDAERASREAAELTTRRLRRRLAITSVALVMALVGGAAFVWQRGRASHQERVAAKALTAQARVEQAVLAQSTLQKDSRALTALLSLAALADGPNFEAVVGLGSSLSNFDRPVESFTAHPDDIETGVLSGDGTLVASGSWDRTVRVWDPTSGESIAVLDGPTTTVRSVAISPTDDLVAAVDACNPDDPDACDQHLRVWRIRTAELLLDLPTGQENVAVGFTDDELVVAHPSAVTKWKLDGTPSGAWSAAELGMGTITTLATRRTSAIAVGDDKGHVRWWQGSTAPASFQTEGAVSALTFSPDATVLAVGDRIGSVTLLDTATATRKGPDPVPLKPEEVPPLALDANQAVLTLAFSRGGDLLSAAGGSREKRSGGDNDVRVWTLPDQHFRRRLVGGTDPVRGVGFRADGAVVALGAERRIRVYETTASGQLWQVTAEPRCDDAGGEVDWLNPSGACWLTSVAFSGTELAVTGWDKTVGLMDPDSGQLISRSAEPGANAQTPFWSWGKRLSADASGTRVAAGTDDGGVQTWRHEGSTLVVDRKLPGRLGADGKPVLINMVQYDKRGTRLATAAADGTIEVWDLETGTSTWRGRHHGTDPNRTTYANGVTWSPDGTRLVSAGEDAHLRMWNAATGEELATADLPYIQNVSAWSPDGRTILSGGDGVIRLWDPDGLKKRKEFYFDSTAIVSASFNQDSTLAVLSDQAKVVRVVDLASGRQLAAFPLDAQPLDAVFSPNEDRLIVTDKDGNLTAFSGPAAWVSAACELAGRNLRKDEWDLYIGEHRPYVRLCSDLPAAPTASDAPTATNLVDNLLASLRSRTA